jgi:hypothetical protein
MDMESSFELIRRAQGGDAAALNSHRGPVK